MAGGGYSASCSRGAACWGDPLRSASSAPASGRTCKQPCPPPHAPRPCPHRQWENAVARLERAEMTRARTGREPTKRTGCCGELVETIPLLQVRPPAAGTTLHQHTMSPPRGCLPNQDSLCAAPTLARLPSISHIHPLPLSLLPCRRRSWSLRCASRRRAAARGPPTSRPPGLCSSKARPRRRWRRARRYTERTPPSFRWGRGGRGAWGSRRHCRRG